MPSAIKIIKDIIPVLPSTYLPKWFNAAIGIQHVNDSLTKPGHDSFKGIVSQTSRYGLILQNGPDGRTNLPCCD